MNKNERIEELETKLANAESRCVVLQNDVQTALNRLLDSNLQSDRFEVALGSLIEAHAHLIDALRLLHNDDA